MRSPLVPFPVFKLSKPFHLIVKKACELAIPQNSRCPQVIPTKSTPRCCRTCEYIIQAQFGLYNVISSDLNKLSTPLPLSLMAFVCQEKPGQRSVPASPNEKQISIHEAECK